MIANNYNLFPLPYWAPAFWQVPMPLQFLQGAYTQGAPLRPEHPTEADEKHQNPASIEGPAPNFDLPSASADP